MKKNLRIHSRHLLFSITLGGALAVGSTMSHAAVIEHQGDRYIIHVAEMELNGEESLLDVLQLCPDFMTLDGNNLLSGDPFSSLYGKYAIRIDNHYSHEETKFNFVWTPTSKDNLEIDAFQTYARNHFTGNLGEYARNYHIQADYTRTLGENGS